MIRTSENQTGGSAAAEAPNINLNLENQVIQNPKDSVAQLDDTPLPLKQIATRYDCYIGSLKNNVRNGRLASLQENGGVQFSVNLLEARRAG